MRVIAFVNQKGGVGKTTTVANTGAYIATKGKSVLLIDIDPQANLTATFGVDTDTLAGSIYEVLQKRASLTDVMIEVEDMKLIPATLELSSADIALSTVIGRESILKKALQKVKYFDFVLIDCPPSLSLLTVNALTAASEVIVPVQAEFLSLRGMQSLFDTIDLIKEDMNPTLKISGIVATLYDGRKNLNRQAIDLVRQHFGEKLLSTMIRDNVALAEAPGHGKTIFKYKPDSYGATDYASLATEILNMTGINS